jgi:hypothetical protein
MIIMDVLAPKTDDSLLPMLQVSFGTFVKWTGREVAARVSQENDDSYKKIIARKWQQSGFKVHGASSALQAVALAQKARKASVSDPAEKQEMVAGLGSTNISKERPPSCRSAINVTLLPHHQTTQISPLHQP